MASSPDLDADVTALISSVGTTVRTMRKERRMTLEQLAAVSGLSVGVVSQLERGIGNPSFATLVQLAHGLEIPVGRLLHIESSTSPVVRAHERRQIQGHGVDAEAVTYHMLVPDLGGALEATWVRSEPGHDTSATPFTHNGEEFGLVVSGQLDVFVDGVCHSLTAGDSIRFSSTVPHWFVNPGPLATDAVWVSTPPTW